MAFPVLLLAAAPYCLTPQALGAGSPRAYRAAEQRGRFVHIANGCVYCHAQQPRDPSLGPDMQRGWGRLGRFDLQATSLDQGPLQTITLYS